MSTDLFTFVKYETLEYDGQEYNKGDLIHIAGERGPFFFVAFVVNPRTNAEWVDVWEENQCFRSFHLDKIRLKRKKRTRVKNSNIKENVGSKRPSKLEPLENVCENHPNYTARRSPRTDCENCWSAYNGRKL